ncbi:MAG: AAA family ATPase [Candidatus Altiarchaeota archaeon]|nr:AAA family ATPase [Candidatus Altiarchaeota archaeon]
MVGKVKTGITGLDDILLGGIPEGNCVLLSGSAGTGKTVLSHQFLFTGAKEGENGIYLSLVEPAEQIIRNMSEFGFFDQTLIDNGKISVKDMTKDIRIKGVDFKDVQGLTDTLREIIEDAEAKRVVIDSITAFCQNIGETTKIRDFILEMGYQLKYLECTSLLISEIPPQKFTYSIYGIEEFIADGVVLLSDFERTGDLIRSLQVVKMRGVGHSRNKHVMKILPEGISILPMFKAGIE